MKIQLSPIRRHDSNPKAWNVQWYSEDPQYAGVGAPPLIEDGIWTIGGRTAYFLSPK
jgi:hypothetical protein